MGIIRIDTHTPRSVYTTKKLLSSFSNQLSPKVVENIENLGVDRRYLAFTPRGKKEEVSDVCIDALRKSLRKAKISKDDLNSLIVTSDASDLLSPGLSGIIAGKMRLTGINHFNLQGMACIAFQKSIQLAEKMRGNGYAAVVLSGCNSGWFMNQARLLDNVKSPSEIKSGKRGQDEMNKWLAVIESFLFGDGVAVVIVGPGGSTVSKSQNITNIGKGDYKSAYFNIAQNNGFSTHTVSHLGKLGGIGMKYCKAVIGKMDVNNEKIDKWALHTGSRKILDSVCRELSIQHSKVQESYDILQNYGNLAGASLPFILEKILKTDAKNCMTLGYGWGFSSSASFLKIKKV